MRRRQDLKLAVPAYFAPGPLWQRLARSTGAVDIAVLNPCSGPGTVLLSAYAYAVRQAQQRGVHLLGYVHTRYGRRPLAETLAEVGRYRAWYGVSGIFVDEASVEHANLSYYESLRQSLRAGDPELLTMLNPGTLPHERYLDVADIVVTFEGDCASYLQAAEPPAWARSYAPDRFCHIVYAAPDVTAMQRALLLAAERHAGRVYITDGALPNPYAALPAYWEAELALAAGR